MWIYYNKFGELTTKIPHGEVIRQGATFNLYIAIDKEYFKEDIEKSTSRKFLSFTLEEIKEWINRNIYATLQIKGLTLETQVHAEILKFVKNKSSEMTFDLIHNTNYIVFHYVGNHTLIKNWGNYETIFKINNYYSNEVNVLGNINFYVEKTYGVSNSGNSGNGGNGGNEWVSYSYLDENYYTKVYIDNLQTGLQENVVHKTGNEIITGVKTFEAQGQTPPVHLKSEMPYVVSDTAGKVGMRAYTQNGMTGDMAGQFAISYSDDYQGYFANMQARCSEEEVHTLRVSHKGPTYHIAINGVESTYNLAFSENHYTKQESDNITEGVLSNIQENKNYISNLESSLPSKYAPISAIGNMVEGIMTGSGFISDLSTTYIGITSVNTNTGNPYYSYCDATLGRGLTIISITPTGKSEFTNDVLEVTHTYDSTTGRIQVTLKTSSQWNVGSFGVSVKYGTRVTGSSNKYYSDTTIGRVYLFSLEQYIPIDSLNSTPSLSFRENVEYNLLQPNISMSKMITETGLYEFSSDGYYSPTIMAYIDVNDTHTNGSRGETLKDILIPIINSPSENMTPTGYALVGFYRESSGVVRVKLISSTTIIRFRRIL